MLSTRSRAFRRRIVRATAAIATTAAVLSGAVALAPAAGAATRLPLTVVGGDGQISAAWTAVPGATGYDVRWGAGTHLTTLRTSGTSVRIAHVTNRRTYHVQVSARGVAASSSRASVQPVPYVPTPIGRVTATPDGPNRVLVRWTGGGRARSVAVVAGADSMLRSSRFSTGWMPAAVRSAVLTVPARLRSTLGAGSGNVVFVKVVQSNSTAARPAMGLTFSLSQKYRLTPSGTWSLTGAAVPAAPLSRLTVASWNVQSITASAGFTAQDQWAARRPKVVANIEDVAPDLIGLQELTTARIVPGCLNPRRGVYACTEQYQTLETALASAPRPYRNVGTDANAWVTGRDNTYVDSALFYDPSRLTLVRSGFLSPKALLGAAWPAGLGDEAGVWAELATVPTAGEPSRSFIAASIHLPAGDLTALRAAEAVAVGDALDAEATRPDGTKLPVVLTGDFNDNGALTPGAASVRLVARGWFDAAATTNRTGIRYSTSNGTNGTDGANPGYPVHAAIHPYATSRIDYIMLLRAPYSTRYDNLVRLLPGDRFDPAYQGSDHNMQVARIGIP